FVVPKCHSQIGKEIFIEIAGSDTHRGAMNKVLGSPQKGAIALSQKHQSMIIPGARHDKIRKMVKIKIIHGYITRLLAGRNNLLVLKTPITIPQKKRQGISLDIAGDQIRKSIPIKITCPDRCRIFTYRIILVMINKVWWLKFLP
ncbi:MAG: hypothetical protein AMK69_12055, partial [Nitrospira bacterium SG8_3]